MKVTLIAQTQVDDVALGQVAPEWAYATPVQDADLLVEFAGRACYQSWLNPSERDNKEYIGNILGHGHFSVLEHGSATFYIEGVSRSLTHELVRHRHFSFSQLSQRFVDLSNAEYVVPPALREYLREYTGGEGVRVDLVLDAAFAASKQAYDKLAAFLEGKGLTRKQAREAARAVLPNMVETSIVVTGNHRSWREFVEKRYTPHADHEIRDLAGLVLLDLRRIAPSIYQDMMPTPY